MSEEKLTYYQKNKEKILERQSLYIKNNKEKVLKQKREWARKHRIELRKKGLMPPTKMQLQQRIDNVNKYIDDLLEKGIDKTILGAIKYMLGEENE